MSETTTRSTSVRPSRVEAVEARHWIERQLEWERTLGSLRTEKSQPAARRAA